MRKTLLLLPLLFTLVVSANDGPIERWAKAAGGREKLATIKSIYREGTIEFAGRQGTIKVWHTAEGKYRKEESLGLLSSIEIYDGTNATVQQNGMPART